MSWACISIINTSEWIVLSVFFCVRVKVHWLSRRSCWWPQHLVRKYCWDSTVFQQTYLWFYPRPIRSFVTQGMKMIATNTCALAKLERLYCVVCADVVKPPLSSQFFIVAVVRVRDSVEGNRTTTSSSRCEWATESLARGHDACFVQSDHNNKHLESSSLEKLFDNN